MQRDRFDHLKGEVAAVRPAQILELVDVINRVVAERFTEMALARRSKAVTENRICPHCKGNKVSLHGRDHNKRQRFKCLNCGRTYNVLTGTVMARARKPEKWCAYLDFMTQHTTVRAIRAAGIGLSHVTIWRWRHRFLKAAANDNTPLLCGVIEADTTLFPHSSKGSRRTQTEISPKIRAAPPANESETEQCPSKKGTLVLSALDRCGGIFQTMLMSLTGIDTALQRRVAAGSILCVGGDAGYARVAEMADAELRVIAAATPMPVVAGAPGAPTPGKRQRNLGLGRVQSHQRGLKQLVDDRCCGVATRYLANYLGWHRAMVRPDFDGKALLARALEMEKCGLGRCDPGN